MYYSKESMTIDLPSYEQLPVKEGAPKGSAWGLFGDEDQLGCLNLVTPQKVVAATKLVRKGTVFALNLRLDLPKPALLDRQSPRHHLLKIGGGIARDDYYDDFWPQASSQWDGLRHIRHPRDGFYNGVPDDEISLEEGSKLGIEHWAKHGIVSRGLLLDVERFLQGQGNPLDPQSSTIIRKKVLAACAEREGVRVEPGDILLIRTGWLRWYLEETTPQQREGIGGTATAGRLAAPGIGPAEEMAEYLWNLHIAAVASDNPALEAWPPTAEGGFLHFRLIPHLGMPIGELWYLEDLATDCEKDGIYEFLLTSAPLHAPGGVASPANALAIK